MVINNGNTRIDNGYLGLYGSVRGSIGMRNGILTSLRQQVYLDSIQVAVDISTKIDSSNDAFIVFRDDTTGKYIGWNYYQDLKAMGLQAGNGFFKNRLFVY